MSSKKNKDGYYSQYVPTGKKKKDGKPKYKKIYGKTKKEIEQKVDEYKQTLRPINDANMTVEAWSEIWFEAYKSVLKITTQSFYKTILNCHILPELGTFKLIDVKRSDCQLVLNEMNSKGLSQKTVNDAKKIMFSLFESAINDNYLLKNPAKGLKAIGAPPKKRRALTEEERKKYLDAIDDSQSGLFAALLYWFGLRRGECLALTGKDINGNTININKQCLYPDNNQAIIEHSTKSKAGEREITIPNEARKYINFENLPEGYLLHDANGNPLSYSEQDDIWKKFIKKAFVDGTEITKHYLRHNYATMLVESGVQPQAAKTICGHSSIKTTMEIYQHMSESLSENTHNLVLTMGQETE